MARKVHLTGSRPDLRVPMRRPWLLGRGDVGNCQGQPRDTDADATRTGRSGA